MTWVISFSISLAVMAAGVPEEPAWKLKAGDTEAALAQVDELVRFADGADTTLEQFDARLAAANGLLSIVLAPIASRELLDIPEDDDRDKARRILQAAGEHLELADKLLTTAAAEPEMDSTRITIRRERFGGVRAFADVFAAIWSEPVARAASSDVKPSEETPPALELPKAEAEEPAASPPSLSDSGSLGEAMMELAIVMEDRRAEVAQAARIWRAYLFSRKGNASRALDMLPLALDPPSGDASVALFARLLRCRLFQQQHDGYSATFALLARLEERINEWFDTPADKAAAQRTVALERRRLMNDWATVYSDVGDLERAKWCASAVERLDGKYFANADARDLLPLKWAAPPIVGLEIPKSIDESSGDTDSDDAEVTSLGLLQE